MNREQFFKKLESIGYVCYLTASRQWHNAYVMHNKNEVLYILSRKNGIDIAKENGTLERLSFNENKLLRIGISGAKRHFFNNSNCFLLDEIFRVAVQFKLGKYDHDNAPIIGNHPRDNPPEVREARKIQAIKFYDDQAIKEHECKIKNLKEKIDVAYGVLGYYPQELCEKLKELELRDIKKEQEEQRKQLQMEREDHGGNWNPDGNDYPDDMFMGYHCR